VRILFDQGTPVPLRHELPIHAISTAHEMGWQALDNGALLNARKQRLICLLPPTKT